MIDRLVQTTASAELASLFQANDDPALISGRPDISPTQDVIAVTADEYGHRDLSTFRWGLVPPWMKDPRIGARMFSARAETLAVKPAFRDSFECRRCIVPANGFFERQRASGRRTKYAMVASDGRPLALAGLWDTWHADGLGAGLRACVIITTTSNALMAPVHDRMPVILGAKDWQTWLDPNNRDIEALSELMQPCPDDWLRASA